MSGLTAGPGRHVELELVAQDGTVERLGLDVVPDAAADFAAGFLGESTPLARAIAGQPAGAELPYHAGDMVAVRILAVEPELRNRPEDLSKRREETTRKALRDSDRTSAIIFASSVNNKWGDYDPSSLVEPDDEEE